MAHQGAVSVEAANLRSALIDNLRLLAFEHWFETTKDKLNGASVSLNSSLFEHQDYVAMSHIMYYLFRLLDPSECRLKFKGSFPSRDRKQEGDFRKIALEWLRKLNAEEGDSWMTKPTPAHLVNPVGDKICKILLDLSNIVILKHCTHANKATVKGHMDSYKVDELEIQASSLDESQEKYRKQISIESQAWESKFKHFTNEHQKLLDQISQSDQKLSELAAIVFDPLELANEDLSLSPEQINHKKEMLYAKFKSLKQNWIKLSNMNREFNKIYTDFDSVVLLLKDMEHSGPSLLKSIDLLQAIKTVGEKLIALKKQLQQINYGEVHKLKDDVLYNIKSLQRWESEQRALLSSLNQHMTKIKEKCSALRSTLLNEPAIKERRERLRLLSNNNPLPTIPKLQVAKPNQRMTSTKQSAIVKEIREAVKEEHEPAVPLPNKDKTYRGMADDSFHFADISALGYHAPATGDMTLDGFSPPKRGIENVTLRHMKSEKKGPTGASDRKALHDIDMRNSFYDLVRKDQSLEGLLNEPPLPPIFD